MSEKILFITRNYPPKVGGLEEYSYHLIREFEFLEAACKITLSKSKKHLLWFFPYALLKALYIIPKYSIRHVHLCDGLLAPIGLILKKLTKVRVSATIHGLDITYSNPLYQRIIPRCVERLDRIVCVSHATRRQLLKRTQIPCKNCAVIPNGIVPDRFHIPQSKNRSAKRNRKPTSYTTWHQ